MRSTLLIPAAALAIACFSTPALAEEERLLGAGPLVGAVGPDTALLWAFPGEGKKTLEVVFAEENQKAGEGIERHVPMVPYAEGGGSLWARLEGLAPATRYTYRVLVDGAANAGTSGRFLTAPPQGQAFRGTFVTASCMDPKRDAAQAAWKAVMAADPALVIQLGDNHYANTPRRPRQLEAHGAQRRATHYAEAIRNVPVVATWDDHDYGANNSDGTLPGKEESLAVFREVWPGSGAGLPETPGVFTRVTYGDVDLFLLDVRYHRTPNLAPDDDRKTMLGDAQWAWFERELARSKATFKLVASGSTLSASRADGWSLYSRDRARLFRLLQKVPGAIFLSGDVHFSVLYTHDPPGGDGYPLYEVISSGIGVVPYRSSFATLAIDTTAKDPTVTVSIIWTDGDGAIVSRDDTTIRRSELRTKW